MIRPHRCPVCDREFTPADDAAQSLFPFCSNRCRQVDLVRWWDGRYRIVEDIDPQAAELMQLDPNITVDNDPE